MPSFTLVQTEKSYRGQTANNTFMISCDDPTFRPNTIQLKAILKKHNLDVVKITSSNPYQKSKVRKSRSNLIKQRRAKKYFVTLQEGQTISEELKLEA